MTNALWVRSRVLPLVLLFFVALFSLNNHAFAYGSTLNVTRGDSGIINWNVAGAATCTGTTNYYFTNPVDDGWYSFWFASHNSSGSSVSLPFYSAPGDYWFKCAEPSGISDTANVHINDCGPGTVWNGSTQCVSNLIITASGGTGGTISPSGSVQVNYGASQTFTITANTGYSISSLTVDGSTVAAQSSYTFSNVTSAHSIVANFIGNSCPSQSGGTGCTLPAGTASGSSGGSCDTGYHGTCSAACSLGSWGSATNNCVQDVSISDFHATPSTVSYNSESTLYWTATGGGTITCRIDNGIGSGLSATGNRETSNLTTSVTYTITCSNGIGPDATRQVTVNVSSPLACAQYTGTGCTLPASPHGTVISPSASYCNVNYVGTCGGTCTNGSWGSITNTCTFNSAPLDPTIGGPAAGYLFETQSFTFTFTSTDPQNDQIKYEIDWDNNGSVDQTLPASGYVNSGTTLSQANNWASAQTATFKARAVDTFGHQSGWTTKSVIISPTPDLTVTSGVSPTTVQEGLIDFSATAKNIGDGPSIPFSNIIQFDDNADHNSGVSNILANVLGALAANTTASITLSRSLLAGTYYTRACADLDASMNGAVFELDENNNCGAWTTVTVNPNMPCAATIKDNCVLPATPHSGTVSGAYCNADDPAIYWGTCVYTCNNTVWNSSGPNTCTASSATLSANPTVTNSGDPVTLMWSSTGNAIRCEAVGGFVAGAPTGNTTVNPTYSPNPYNYQLRCYDHLDAHSWLSNIATVEVRNAKATISVSPNRVAPGGSVTVSWTSQDVTSCSIKKAGAVVAWGNNLPADAGFQVNGSHASETIDRQVVYSISCMSKAGSTVTSKAVANVTGSFAPF